MINALFTVKIQHDEDVLIALSHMRYDLFSTGNRIARRIAYQIKASDISSPCSAYQFESAGMRVIAMPEQEETAFLLYNSALRLGEDPRAYYLFFNPYGGYMIPKKELGGREVEFHRFIETKTGKAFVRRQTPARVFKQWLAHRK